MSEKKIFYQLSCRWASSKGWDSQALANESKLILADEPTGSLDPENSNSLLSCSSFSSERVLSDSGKL